jgi:hypothetical protein
MGMSCDMVQPHLATSTLEMANLSLTFLNFGEYLIVASAKVIVADMPFL